MNQSMQDRKYKAVGGSFNRPAMAPGPQRKGPRKPKGPAQTPGIACRVKNAEGEYYDFMGVYVYRGETEGNYLYINKSNPDGHLFQSRHKAGRAVSHTLERRKNEPKRTGGRDFFLENVR